MAQAHRPYKQAHPIETIGKIRNKLLSMGILTVEKQWGAPLPNIHSVSVSTTCSYGNFSTNGKATSQEYCLASAYGEFIERIQNNLPLLNIPLVILKSLKEEQGFYIYPDELYLNKKELLSVPENILLDLFSSSKIRTREEYFETATRNTGNGCLGIPFLNYKTGELTAIPYNLFISAVGSNGMAAGNTKEEAITQAIFELLERWAGAQVFFDQLTPPDIPDSFLKKYPAEWELISNLRETGLLVQIKDFSCGIGLPVIGTLAIDSEKNRYQLNLGCETSFAVALSRSITELYQGVQKSGELDFRMLKVPQQTPWYFLENSEKATIEKEEQFRKFIINGLGKYPRSLFNNTSSYAFSSEHFAPQDSYKEEARFWLKKIQNMGHDIYIRDVSFLNFPCYHVYIPKISSVGHWYASKTYSVQKTNELENILMNCYSLNSASLDVLKNTADYLTQLPPEIPLLSIFNLDIAPEYKAQHTPIGLFTAVLYIILRDRFSATHAVKNFLDSAKEATWISIVQNIKLLLTNKTSTLSAHSEKIDTLLQLANQHINQNSDSTSQILKLFSLPSCPDCSQCKINTHCYTKGRIELTRTVFEEYKRNHNNVSQKNFQDLY